ncbi:diguanylate cyclase [Alteromonadaceae bacterium BrNp21-10]|nr:diguanylate cyclase [Alteromonadaceae bacterium BrNp21-10]
MSASANTLTTQEREYLEQRGPIRYCVDPKWMPLEGIKNSQHIGISKSYISLFSQYLHHPFQLIETSSWRQSLDNLRADKCELLPLLNQTEERSIFMNFTAVYVMLPAVMVTQKGIKDVKTFADLEGKTVALVDGYRFQEVLARQNSNIIQVLVESESIALQMVANAEVDAMVGTLLLVSNEIKRLGLPYIQISSSPEYYDNLRVGVAKNQPILLSIMDKAVRSINDAQQDDIFRQWSTNAYTEEADYSNFWWGFFSVLFVSLFMGYRYYVLAMNSVHLDSKNFELDLKNRELLKLQEQLKKRNQKLEYLSTHDSLTNLVNRHFFEENVEKERNRAKRNANVMSLLLIDLDNFKIINDTFGHTAGDNVLFEVAKVLKQQVRSVDVVGRWGGEEFIILLPDTGLSDAVPLAERIREAVYHIDVIGLHKVSCSIGVMEFAPTEDLNTAFVQVDKALYKAKEAGRNRVETIE